MFNFNGNKKIFFAISLVLMVASIISLAFQGFNLDTDFAGGMAVTYEIKGDFEVKDVEVVVYKEVLRNTGRECDVLTPLFVRNPLKRNASEEYSDKE